MAYPRSDWKARPPRDLARDSQAKHTLVVHHSDFLGAPIQTRAQQRSALRGIQDFHMDHNGWADIGYDFVLFQPEGRIRSAKLYQARPIWAIPAAQLGANSGTIPVCVVGNFDIEGVKHTTFERLQSIITHLRHHYPLERVKGHRDLTSTDCPGRHLYALVDDLDRFLRA